MFGPVEDAPLERLHPLEEPEPTLLPGWEAGAVSRLRSSFEPFQTFERCGRALVDLVRVPSAPRPGDAVVPAAAAADRTLECVWPGWETGMLQAMLLRKRTALYTATCDADASPSAAAAAASGGGGGVAEAPRFTRATVPGLPELAVGRLRDAHADRLRGLNEARDAELRRRLLAVAVEELLRLSLAAAAASPSLADDDDSPEPYAPLLKDLFLDLDLDGGRRPPTTSQRPEGAAPGPTARL
jgi:hypothetical protein